MSEHKTTSNASLVYGQVKNPNLRAATGNECAPYDDTWLKDILQKMEDLKIPEIASEKLDFCKILDGDNISGYTGNVPTILSFYMREVDKVILSNPNLSLSDTNKLKLDAITTAFDQGVKIEIEKVNIANKNNESMFAIILQKLKTYETIADLRMKLELFLIERDIAYAKLLSMKADYLLKRTQGISFVFNQRAKLVDMLFNTVVVGVTQEMMHIMNQPNEVMGGLSPKQRFEEAWMDDSYLKDLNDLEWEGLCSPKSCECELCTGA